MIQANLKKTHSYNGLFITFEGPEGSGKTSVVKNVIEFFENNGLQNEFDYISTKEPGTPRNKICKSLREFILNPDNDINKDAEIFLYMADRCQHVGEVLIPALSEGKIVICDRYIHSTEAYQGYGRRMGKSKAMNKIKTLNSYSTNDLNPDLVFLLDVDTEVGLQRATQTEFGRPDRLESEAIEFHRRVREGYLEIFKSYSGNMIKIDTNHKSQKQVSEEVINHIKELEVI